MPAVDTGPTASAPEDRETHALQDWQDLRAADVVVAFTEDPDGPPISSRGGRHVEFGIAMEMDKNLCVVGYRENIWHFLSAVKFFESQWEFLTVRGGTRCGRKLAMKRGCKGSIINGYVATSSLTSSPVS